MKQYASTNENKMLARNRNLNTSAETNDAARDLSEGQRDYCGLRSKGELAMVQRFRKGCGQKGYRQESERRKEGLRRRLLGDLLECLWFEMACES